MRLSALVSVREILPEIYSLTDGASFFTTLFGSLHFVQGIVGLVFGAVHLLNRRRLWTLIVAHASFDLTSLAIIYFGLEERIGSSLLH